MSHTEKPFHITWSAWNLMKSQSAPKPFPRKVCSTGPIISRSHRSSPLKMSSEANLLDLTISFIFLKFLCGTKIVKTCLPETLSVGRNSAQLIDNPQKIVRLTKKYFVVISFAVAQAASRLRLSVANGEIYNTNMYKDVSTPVGLST